MKIADIIREVLEVDFSDETLNQTGIKCAAFLASRDEAKLTHLWQYWLGLNEVISGAVGIAEYVSPLYSVSPSRRRSSPGLKPSSATRSIRLAGT